MAKYTIPYTDKKADVDLLKYNWTAGENAFDYEGLVKFDSGIPDGLVSIFSEDKDLQDDDFAFDKYLYVYYDMDGHGRPYVTEIGYDRGADAATNILEVTESEMTYFTTLLRNALL